MRIWAIILRILRQFRRDKRTLALMFIAPIFVLTLMNIVFNGSQYEPKLGSINTPDVMNESFEKLGATVLKYETREEAEAALDERKIDALVESSEAQLQVKIEGSEPSVNKAVLLLMQKVGEGLQSDVASPNLSITYLHGSEDMTSIDQLGPILIGFFIFFFVFLIAGVSFLRERTTGTLERLLSTPLKRWEIVLGYTGGFGLFTILQALLISWYSIKVLGILMTGSFLFVLLLTLLMSMTALTLGTLVSAFANNELQMIQFIPLIIVPQFFLSGMFPLETLPDWLRGFGVIMPLTYGAHALTNVMIRGKGWEAIASDVYVLIGFSLLFILLNILALRKHRKI
ncbi:ABC-2 type transport system permease protein [Paenibacillus anaericanus]|uniref:ABC transporter permease n=1 Tax=Paenibacillus anaericanus TaxID=170367 RepID=UPI002785E219|nr:ABC transporter permease [Paenibacillus anaericanus]MDQ0090825.1 ABC-2 type transport system permease protein [Paenibacillus anaericanus]